MATEAQILANRLNARKSTGPRTAVGKAIVARNAVKHGLCGTETVVAGEDPGEFEFYRERMIGELEPVGEVEAELAERIISLAWRLKRAERLQAVAFDSLLARQTHDLCEKFEEKRDADGDSTFGRAIVRDFSNGRVLDRLLMYERRIEHSLYRSMAELKRHRLLQEVGPGGMWELRRALARDADDGEEVVRGRTTYEEPPAAGFVREAAGVENHGRDARAAKTLHTLSCKTKPIWPSADHGQTACNKALTADSPRGQPGETKPIPTAEELSGSTFHESGGMAPLPACGPFLTGHGALQPGERNSTINRFVPVCAGVGYAGNADASGRMGQRLE